jgi:nucleoporin NUP159
MSTQVSSCPTATCPINADTQWLQLINTAHEVYVRVSEGVALDGLPFECNLLAVSNRNDLLAVGGNNGASLL